MHNPFRDSMMRDVFAEDVAAFGRASSALFTAAGGRNTSHSRGIYFWKGYDNERPAAWDAPSRRMLSYASYRAGRACATKAGH